MNSAIYNLSQTLKSSSWVHECGFAVLPNPAVLMCFTSKYTYSVIVVIIVTIGTPSIMVLYFGSGKTADFHVS